MKVMGGVKEEAGDGPLFYTFGLGIVEMRVVIP